MDTNDISDNICKEIASSKHQSGSLKQAIYLDEWAWSMGSWKKYIYRQGTPPFYSVTIFPFESALLRTLCGFSPPASFTIFISLLLCHLFLLHVLVVFFFLVFFSLAGAVFQRSGRRGALGQTKIKRGGERKAQAVFGEPEGWKEEGGKGTVVHIGSPATLNINTFSHLCPISDIR